MTYFFAKNDTFPHNFSHIKLADTELHTGAKFQANWFLIHRVN